MEFTFSKGRISLSDKEMTPLDRSVVEFLKYLNAKYVKYVIVSGYISILFGRTRNTEDVDLLLNKMGRDAFAELYKKITSSGKYYCINANSPNLAYSILEDKSSVRFAKNGTIEPNFEVKFPQNELSTYSLDHPIRLLLNNKHEINMGPLELQIAYKLYLGSEKDYLDAAHMYGIFRGHLDAKELKRFIEKLDITDDTVREVLGENP